jgi:hypothetical protein
MLKNSDQLDQTMNELFRMLENRYGKKVKK